MPLALIAQALAGASLIQIVIVLVVIGVVLWLLETQVQIDPTIRTIIRVVVILAICLWLLRIAAIL